jgi:hypothetical protein
MPHHARRIKYSNHVLGCEVSVRVESPNSISAAQKANRQLLLLVNSSSESENRSAKLLEYLQSWLHSIWEKCHMCRNIKTLYNFAPPVTPDEVQAASVQFVRKITGFHKPSKANEEPLNNAVAEIARISSHLLHALETTAPPRNREEEAAKARARAAERFGD